MARRADWPSTASMTSYPCPSGACEGAPESRARHRQRGSRDARDSRQQIPHSVRERGEFDRLAQVIVESRGQRSLAITEHRVSSEGNDAQPSDRARSARISLNACQPSMSGSPRSISTRSGSRARANAMPAAAVSAVKTSCPAARRSLVASARFAGVSSTRRMVATTAAHGCGRVLPEHTQEWVVLDRLAHMRIDTVRHVGPVNDGHHDHRDLAGGGVGLELSEKVVSFGHGDVEQDRGRL